MENVQEKDGKGKEENDEKLKKMGKEENQKFKGKKAETFFFFFCF